MSQYIKERNRLLAQKILKGLASRNMEGCFVETKEEALKKALEIIPEGAKVSWGGATSAGEIGLLKVMLEGNYETHPRETAPTPEEKRAAELFAYAADYYLASVNAITEDGILINIDGNANRVSAIAYGPLHVLFIVGMNKVATDFDAALSRARGIAATSNAQRFPLDTPCKKTGACADCKSPDTICCQFLTTRYSKHPGRIQVILVNEDLGF